MMREKEKNTGRSGRFLCRVLSLLLICIMIGVSSFSPSVSSAKAQTSAQVYSAVKKAYGTKFPLKNSNVIVTDLKNIFGEYSTVLGVSAKYFSEYKAAKKSSSKEEYICFICKAKSSSDVSSIKTAMKKFVSSETKSNTNYFSSKGKSLMKNAKIGSKGNFVYLFVIDTNKNKKAVKAFKKALS